MLLFTGMMAFLLGLLSLYAAFWEALRKLRSRDLASRIGAHDWACGELRKKPNRSSRPSGIPPKSAQSRVCGRLTAAADVQLLGEGLFEVARRWIGRRHLLVGHVFGLRLPMTHRRLGQRSALLRACVRGGSILRKSPDGSHSAAEKNCGREYDRVRTHQPLPMSDSSQLSAET
jgi:hypothetical protein